MIAREFRQSLAASASITRADLSSADSSTARRRRGGMLLLVDFRFRPSRSIRRIFGHHHGKVSRMDNDPGLPRPVSSCGPGRARQRGKRTPARSGFAEPRRGGGGGIFGARRSIITPGRFGEVRNPARFQEASSAYRAFGLSIQKQGRGVAKASVVVREWTRRPAEPRCLPRVRQEMFGKTPRERTTGSFGRCRHSGGANKVDRVSFDWAVRGAGRGPIPRFRRGLRFVLSRRRRRLRVDCLPSSPARRPAENKRERKNLRESRTNRVVDRRVAVAGWNGAHPRRRRSLRGSWRNVMTGVEPSKSIP